MPTAIDMQSSDPVPFQSVEVLWVARTGNELNPEYAVETDFTYIIETYIMFYLFTATNTEVYRTSQSSDLCHSI